MVPLADLADPDLLSPAVAEALGLQVTDRPWQVDTLADHIAHRAALLVLDNCEHLLAAVSDLVAGLRATCPNLSFLLTSRRPLRLSGEDVIVVRPLSLPEQATVATPEAIAHYEAVDLFLDRATSARSDFELTPDNAPAVVTLCRELDGVPLAIELAAARIRVLSPQEICDSLAERLKVLNLGYRDAEDRHQSLRACVEWSYDLCTPLEQRFWARSSVFCGGCDLEAAAAVCACRRPARRGGPRPDERTRRPVGRPRRRSQPRVTRGTACSPTSGSSASSRPRRTASSTACSSGTPPGSPTWSRGSKTDACGPHQTDWLRRLRLEHANLRAAIEYFAGAAGGRRGRPGHGAGSSTCTGPPPDCSTRHATGWRSGWPRGAGTPQERALALAVAARFAVLQNDRLRAEELIDEGNEVATPVDDTRALGLLMVPAAMLSIWDGTPAAAADQADRAVALLRAASDRPGELLALFVAGVCHGFAGNGVEAAARHRQCIARADEVGERHMKALAVAGLGEQELAGGHLEEATALFCEAIVLKQELGDRMGMAVALDSLGRVATAEGRR